MEQLAKKWDRMKMKKAQSGSDGYKPEAVPNILKVIHSRLESNNELGERGMDNSLKKEDFTMKSPINNRINTVFIHVRNLEKSAAWYCEVLGIDYKEGSAEGSGIFDLPMDGTSGITLDSGYSRGISQLSSQPLFNFNAPDIEKAYQYIKEKEIEIVDEIMRFGKVAYFTFKDLDGNIIMACNC